MGKIKSLSEQVFGRLTVLKLSAERTGSGGARWECICECGNVTIVSSTNLSTGHTTSCGCFGQETRGKSVTTHGKCKTRAYKSWQGMKNRCRESNDHHRNRRYSGRGISVCSEWVDSFEAFYRDMGECPEGLSIDRIDNDKGYRPGNCRWATGAQQGNNKENNNLVTFAGKTLTHVQWSRRLGGADTLVRHRINEWGWDPIRAVTTPVRSCRAKGA